MKQYSHVMCEIRQMDNLDILTESSGSTIQAIPKGVGDITEWKV